MLDGNKRVAFAAAHTFFLNGLDLGIDPLAAYEFMMRSIFRAAFRFAHILAWISDHIIEHS